MMTIGGLCLPLLLLVTLLPAGLAYGVFRTGSNRAADPSSVHSDDSTGGATTWKLCESLACSHLDSLSRDACLLQCVYVLSNYGNGNGNHQDVIDVDHTYRRQVEPLQSCIEAKCPGGDMECIVENCINRHDLGLKLKLKERESEDTAPGQEELGSYEQPQAASNSLDLGGIYGDKRSGIYGLKRRGTDGIYGLKRGGIYGLKRGGIYGVKRGGIYGVKRGGIYGIKRAGTYGVRRGGTYGIVKAVEEQTKRHQAVHQVEPRSWGEAYITCLESRCTEWEDNPSGPAYNECASLCKLT